MGSKRFVFEDGYFTALNRDNVTPLWGALSGMTEHGFVLDDGRSFDADYVVLSTGFDLDVSLGYTDADTRPACSILSAVMSRARIFVLAPISSSTTA